MTEAKMTCEPPDEDEIDLRELFHTIVKRKKMIAILFGSAVLIAITFSVSIPRVYEGRVSLMIPSVKEGVEGAFTLEMHKELLRSNIVLQKTIGQLNLVDRAGRLVGVDDLLGMISLSEVKGTSILQLRVRHDAPEVAAEVANAWAVTYVDCIRELMAAENRDGRDFIERQFSLAQESLADVEERVKEFKNQYIADLVEEGLNIKKAKLNEYQKKILDARMIIKRDENILVELKQQIAGQEKVVVLSKAITDDALWQRMDHDLSAFDKRLRTEEINPIYRDLEARIVNTEIELKTTKVQVEDLAKEAAVLEKEITALAETVHQKAVDWAQLSRQVDTAQKIYDIFKTRMEGLRMSAAGHNTKILSLANPPKTPIARGTAKRVMMAGILSLVLGVFAAVGMEFMGNSK